MSALCSAAEGRAPSPQPPIAQGKNSPMSGSVLPQAELNAALDLDKNETQVAPPAEDDVESPGDALQAPSIPAKILRNSAPGISP